MKTIRQKVTQVFHQSSNMTVDWISAKQSEGVRIKKYSEIGSGTYGAVYNAALTFEHTDEIIPVAIKQFRRFSNTVQKDQSEFPPWVIREIQALRRLRHCPYIIPLLHVCTQTPIDRQDEGPISLIFPRLDADLQTIIRLYRRQVLRGEENHLCLATIRSITFQLLSALEYMHRHWFIHHDIKPENILMDSRNQCIRLIDFGLTRRCESLPQDAMYRQGLVQSLWYRAPEVLLGFKSHTCAVDMWSVGCLLGAMIRCQTGLFCGVAAVKKDERVLQHHPFEDDQMRKILECLPFAEVVGYQECRYREDMKRLLDAMGSNGRTDETRLRRLLSRQVDGYIYSLLESLLQFEPSHRFTAAEALQHPWFAEDRESLKHVVLK